MWLLEEGEELDSTKSYITLTISACVSPWHSVTTDGWGFLVRNNEDKNNEGTGRVVFEFRLGLELAGRSSVVMRLPARKGGHLHPHCQHHLGVCVQCCASGH